MFLSGLRASMALAEGICGAVESGEPSLRVSWVSNSKLRNWSGLRRQNKDCLQESGDEMTGSQPRGDSELCRGEAVCMAECTQAF